MMLLLLACQPLTFQVDGTTAVLTGDLTSNAPKKIERLLAENPNLEWIEMLYCPGSLDDEAVMEAGRLLRASGVNTIVPVDGEIYSGGVDLFTAGVRRIVLDGGIVGVHSWKAGSMEGAELSEDDPEHEMYLLYYADMGIPEEFYWFTLQAAPSSGMHDRSREELEQYFIVTE